MFNCHRDLVVRKLSFLVISVAYPTMIVYAGLKGNQTFAFGTKQTFEKLTFIWLDKSSQI
jgi:hypothetical protein